MDILFHIDQKSSIPIYVQIMDQIKHHIATGVLKPGQQLPTIRELAVELTINLHTVAHAYAELEREGFLTIQRGRGTFISDVDHQEQLGDLRESKLQALVESLVAEAMSLGYGVEELQQAMVKHVEQWQKEAKKTAARG